MLPGVFLFTLDTEALWGVPERRSSGTYERHMGNEFRRVTRELLDLLDEYEVPATWAVVGHLFLETCEGPLHGHLHLEQPRHSWFPDWYYNDPGTNVHSDPGWYAPDIVDAILGSKTRHEIACHSFSHCIFGDSGCERRVAVSELAECRRLADSKAIELKSFVFPRNSVGHLDVLRESGYLCYRGPYSSSPTTGVLRFLRRAYGVAKEFIPSAPPTSECTMTEGLVAIPDSMLIRSRLGWRKVIPLSITQYRAQLGIRDASDKGTIFHIWTHPLNLAYQRVAMFDLLRSVLETVNRERERGRIRTCTMAEVAEQFIATHQS